MADNNQQYHIPKHGKADVAFLGVEFKDTYLLILSVIFGLTFGQQFGLFGQIGIPVIGYMLNKSFLDWKKSQLPGYTNEFLYKLGIKGFSSGMNKSNKIFVGDARPINTGLSKQVAKIIRENNYAA